MTTGGQENYPDAAYSPDGRLWWRTDVGDERKISAWLAFNIEPGDTFTMRKLRDALGDGLSANSAEHLNRRLRELRHRDGWEIPSNKDDRTLPTDTYRVERVGWHPGLGTPRSQSRAISQSVRRRVLDRDGYRCRLCGMGAGEEYPGQPGSRAVLTVGHVVASAHSGSSSELDNLRTECKSCNEPVRHEMRPPETYDEVLPSVRKLRTPELRRLLAWLEAGQRLRDDLDLVYDRVRILADSERTRMLDTVRRILRGAK